MYTSGSIANSQRILTEINESGATAKIKILVESHTVKAFRKVSSKFLENLTS